MLDVPSKVLTKMMKQAQEEDLKISNIMHYVKYEQKPSLAQMSTLCLMCLMSMKLRAMLP